MDYTHTHTRTDMKNVEKSKTKALIVYSLMNEYTLEKKGLLNFSFVFLIMINCCLKS